MTRAAAIYARISSDRLGDSAGVKRQVADCEAEADRRGWPVAGVYIDDDVSAYSGKRRPEYERLIADVRDGVCDAVLVYHPRLTRRPKELEEFVEVCERAGMRSLATVQGDVNLGTGDGLLIARIMGAVAANESASKSRRVRRKMEELAMQGRPHGGATRPFGYEADRVTLRAEEAVIIRQLTGRLLAGESMTSLCNWLADNDVPTVRGGTWGTTTLRNVLMSARISGQREHKGEIVAEAEWPAIITPEQTQQIRAILTDPSRRTNRTARRYLLSGLLVCGRCGSKLFSHPRGGVRRYACKSGTSFQGCGQMTIPADPTEQLIAAAVLHRLDGPELSAALQGRIVTDEHARALNDALSSDRAQLDELATLYAEKAITGAEWMTARKPIEVRMTATSRQLATATRSSTIDQWIGQGEQLRAAWAELNLTRQAAIIKAVLTHAVIAAVPGNAATFSIDRVTPYWRL